VSEDYERIVRRMFEEWNEHRSDLAVKYFDPGIELDTRGLPQPDWQGLYRGIDEFTQWARTWVSAWENAQQFPIWVEQRGDRVAAWVRMRLVGRRSGIGGDYAGGWSFTFQDDKVVRVRLFTDESETRAELDAPS
jgi:ketosteroid isomerase-like protein